MDGTGNLNFSSKIDSCSSSILCSYAIMAAAPSANSS